MHFKWIVWRGVTLCWEYILQFEDSFTNIAVFIFNALKPDKEY